MTKDELAELGVSLILWLLFIVVLMVFTTGATWLIIKSGMIIILIYGVRDFFIHLTLLRYQEVDKSED